ncbi:hypothetical protein [Proteus mirabilis]|uniref:hypothetical protein n=1 Tax=Proteus mirabilis TaxID=584 RepID=UPI0034D49B52
MKLLKTVLTSVALLTAITTTSVSAASKGQDLQFVEDAVYCLILGQTMMGVPQDNVRIRGYQLYQAINTDTTINGYLEIVDRLYPEREVNVAARRGVNNAAGINKNTLYYQSDAYAQQCFDAIPIMKQNARKWKAEHYSK